MSGLGAILKATWDGINNFQSAQSLLKSEFAQNWIYPFILPLAALLSGFYQQVPLMWIIVGTVWCFAGVVVSMAALLAYRQYNTPQNKLTYQVIYQQDLNQPEAPMSGNRQQRRAQPARLLGLMELNPAVSREILKGQLGVEIFNTATFPISCILQSSTVKILGEQPKRSLFPKDPVKVSPGSKIRILDDAINLDHIACQRLSGEINMLIKYGREGKEKFDISIKGVVDIVMTEFGFVNNVVLEYRDPPPEPVIPPIVPVRRRS